MTTTENLFAGGVAVVTGAGSGIGKALALHAASLGMKVVVADANMERGVETLDEIIATDGEGMVKQTDVGNFRSVTELADSTFNKYGQVDLLVNNAGISVMGKIWEVPIEEWNRSVDVNFRGVVHGIKAFLPRMLESDTQKYICNTASLASFSMASKMTPYFTTKHALLSLSECLYIEMQEENKPIQVSVAAPGMISTRIFADTVAAEEAGNNHKDMMATALSQTGMPASDAAKVIFDGIAAGDFVISTHPMFTESLAKQRANYLNNIHSAKPLQSDPGFLDND